MKLLWFCAAGYSFFLGTGFLLLAILFPTFREKIWRSIIVYALIIVGAFMIFLSATPFSWWFYTIWATAVLGWLCLFTLRLYLTSKFPSLLRIIAAFLSIAALLLELTFHLKPYIPQEKLEKMYVIGDSVSAGIGGKEEQTWPKILSRKYRIDVIDLSESGATVASAMRQAIQVRSENAIVLLEIGGNDLFAPTPPFLFEKHMRQLLKTVSSSKRTVIILELPLQPWHISYGRIQRQLAKQFNAILIPKRFFVSVLAAKGASTDLAHLSPGGHEFMAEKIWSLVKDSMLPLTKLSENQNYP
jgi:lysophospholipase L1-like esterase